jgi:hypothetical protein
MMAIPLIFIGHHTIPVGYSKVSGAGAGIGFLRAAIITKLFGRFF